MLTLEHIQSEFRADAQPIEARSENNVAADSSKARKPEMAEELVISGVPNVDCLHAGMTKKEREDAVSRMRRGESWVMVSTEVMARGMDFKGVREVINYDFPQSVQSYVHRIGACTGQRRGPSPPGCGAEN